MPDGVCTACRRCPGCSGRRLHGVQTVSWVLRTAVARDDVALTSNGRAVPHRLWYSAAKSGAQSHRRRVQIGVFGAEAARRYAEHRKRRDGPVSEASERRSRGPVGSSRSRNTVPLGSLPALASRTAAYPANTAGPACSQQAPRSCRHTVHTPRTGSSTPLPVCRGGMPSDPAPCPMNSYRHRLRLSRARRKGRYPPPPRNTQNSRNRWVLMDRSTTCMGPTAHWRDPNSSRMFLVSTHPGRTHTSTLHRCLDSRSEGPPADHTCGSIGNHHHRSPRSRRSSSPLSTAAKGHRRGYGRWPRTSHTGLNTLDLRSPSDRRRHCP